MVTSNTPKELRERIDSDEPLAVLDIREEFDYVRGNILESTPVPRESLESRIVNLVPNRKTPIVLCDRDGDRAEADTEWLEQHGYDAVAFLHGGMKAWTNAGFDVINAVDGVSGTARNYESKYFGEVIEHREELASLTPEKFAERRDDEDPLVIDVRNPQEYRWSTVPGSINVEGVDIGLYIETLREDDQPIVVHCGGRTRGIIAAATLKKFGIDHVYELENGRMGWELAGYEPETNADRTIQNVDVDGLQYDRIKAKAEALTEGTDIRLLKPAELATITREVDERQTVYIVDVRTQTEYDNEHLPGTISVPGGQAIQTTENHFAVRDAEIVFVSNTHVRSAVTAYWFDEMGFENVSLLEEGLEGWREKGRNLFEGESVTVGLAADIVDEMAVDVSPDELSDCLEDVTVVHIDDSETFEGGHVPGAKWIPRYELEAEIADDECASRLVLVCSDGTVSRYAAAQLGAQTEYCVTVLEGGVSAWQDAGYPTVEGTDGMIVEPRKITAKPYHQGNCTMRKYLEWEANLVEKN